MSKEEYLAQYPKNVIHKGNIVPIREELERRFKETGKIDTSKLNTNEPIEVPTEVAQDDSGKFQPEQIVTLRIRTETACFLHVCSLENFGTREKPYETR